MSTESHQTPLPSERTALWECCLIDAELDAFAAQAPLLRREDNNTDYYVVREAELCSAPPAEEIYLEWQYARAICSMRSGNWYEYLMGESDTLLHAYAYGLHLDRGGLPLYSQQAVTGADFRDAVLDALAEFLDDHGFGHFDWQLFDRITARPMAWRLRHLVALYLALTTPPRYHGAATNNRAVPFQIAFRDELSVLPRGWTYRDIWEKFMRSRRCRFHEHLGGGCWRRNR